jgi:hypothetical protein
MTKSITICALVGLICLVTRCRTAAELASKSALREAFWQASEALHHLESVGTTNIQHLLRRVESQVSQSTDVKERALTSIHNSKKHMLANAAPGDKARTVHVETSFGKAPR